MIAAFISAAVLAVAGVVLNLVSFVLFRSGNGRRPGWWFRAGVLGMLCLGLAVVAAIVSFMLAIVGLFS